MLKFRSDRDRPVHMGRYRVERLARGDTVRDVPPYQPIHFDAPPESLISAIAPYQAMLDAIRDGYAKRERAVIPDDPTERANHLKAFGYYQDASLMGVCRTDGAFLDAPTVNPGVAALAEELRTKQVRSQAAGVDVIMAELKESMSRPPEACTHHTHALVFLTEYVREPDIHEPGSDWIRGCQAHRASVRGAENAVVIANYIRLLGYEARAHTMAASDVDLNRLAVASGLAIVENDKLVAPWIGTGFGLAAITTTLEIAPDSPLAPQNLPRGRPAYSHRRFKDGAHPFERIKRVETPTTYLDEARIPRIPKRTDMFARSLFGDMGKKNQEAAKRGNYLRKSATAFAPRHALGAFIMLEDRDPAPTRNPMVAQQDKAADLVKAASYFLGIDAVGISRCPDWAWYSHNAAAEPIPPRHDHAISMIVDQGYDTMEGASGDDWIAASQSMRAYLRFSLIGGIIAQHIRNMGYEAQVHTVMNSTVLQPPLLLLAGLGEVSRIGEVILNPYLGPRLKSGVVTTNMPMAHDKPIDFGLQKFCDACNKCARECPSGAITAGPKRMFNGYEIWKSDSQKCTTYRITQDGGAMCGRCMKTCPWNLEGLFAEAPFRWAASHIPALAKPLAKLDDKIGKGGLNPVKKWWWDLEMRDEGPYQPPAEPVNKRDLQPEIDLKFTDQTLAVYPANLAPPPWPYPFPMDREAGIKAYNEMLSAEQYKALLARGATEKLAHKYVADQGESPVLAVVVSKVEQMTPDIIKYEFQSADGSDLPPFTAGAHIDVVIAPEFFRQYSLSGDPADRKTYQIGVLREDAGRGGSVLMQRIFTEGRKLYISKPINHFPLAEGRKHYLMGGGIGVTPMIAMAYELHAKGSPFELHYSYTSRDSAGYLSDLAATLWRTHHHCSADQTRADLSAILRYEPDAHVYACGPDRYIAAVQDAARANGFPDENIHIEYFTLPEEPEYENHPFTLHLTKSNRDIHVAADETAADVLNAAGFNVLVKCADGLCGTCKCGLIGGEVEHRDHVLSAQQRETAIILCRSRAADKDGIIEIDL